MSEVFYDPAAEMTAKRGGRGKGKLNIPANSEEKPPVPAPFAVPPHDPLFKDMLEKLKPEEHGTISKAHVPVNVDISPSVYDHFGELRDAHKAAGEVIAGSAAKSRIYTTTIFGAEDATVFGLERGALTLPKEVEFGSGTFGMPWLKKMLGVSAQFCDHLKAKGIARTPSFAIVYSDFCLTDRKEVLEALDGWKAEMKKRCGLVVVAATFGHMPDVEVAGRFSAPLPPVNSRDVPLKALFTSLARTLTTSLSRPGGLEEMLKAEIAKLQAGNP